MVTPYSEDSNKPYKLGTKEGKSMYDKATESLYSEGETKFNCETIQIQPFINRLKDRHIKCGFGVRIAVTKTVNGLQYTEYYDMLRDYGKYSLEEAQAFARRKYLGKKTKEAQVDIMIYMCIIRSLDQDTYDMIITERHRYELIDEGSGDTHCSGIVLHKLLIIRSKMSTALDPATLKVQLSMAAAKYAELGHNTPELEKWMVTNRTFLRIQGHESTDILAHMTRALKSHPDQELTQYITNWADNKSDNGIAYTEHEMIKAFRAKEEHMAATSETDRLL